MKRTFTLFLLINLFIVASAQTFTNGTGGGNWASTGTWIGGVVPTSGVIVVQSGDRLIVNGNYSVDSVAFLYDNSTNNSFVLNLNNTLTCRIMSVVPTTDNAEATITINGTLNITTGTGNHFVVSGTASEDNLDVEINVNSTGQMLMDNSFIFNSESSSTNLSLTTVGKFRSGPMVLDFDEPDCNFNLDINGDFDFTTFTVTMSADNVDTEIHLRPGADVDGTGNVTIRSYDQDNGITIVTDDGSTFNTNGNFRFEGNGDDNTTDVDIDGDLACSVFECYNVGNNGAIDLDIGSTGSVTTGSRVRMISSGGSNLLLKLNIASGGQMSIGDFLDIRSSNNGTYDVDIDGILVISKDFRSQFRTNTSGTWSIAGTGSWTTNGCTFDHRNSGDLAFNNFGTFIDNGKFEVLADANDVLTFNWISATSISGNYNQETNGSNSTVTTNVSDELTVRDLQFNLVGAAVSANNVMNINNTDAILNLNAINFQSANKGTLTTGNLNNSTVNFNGAVSGDSIPTTSTVEFDNITVSNTTGIALKGPLNAANFYGDFNISIGASLTLTDAGEITTQGNFTNSGGLIQNNAETDFTVIGNYSNTGTHGSIGGDYFFEGDFVNTGTFENDDDIVVNFSGSVGTQNISGTTTFFEVVASNDVLVSSGTTSIQTSLEVTGSSTFNANSNLVLLSNTTGTAMVKELTAGNSVSGNVRVQRRLAEGTGYHMLGSPTTNGTIAQWADDIWTGGFTGSTSPGAGVSVYSYDEATRGGLAYEEGYVAATNATNALTSTRGYMVYVLTSPSTVEVTGPLTQGNNIGTGSLSHTVGSVGVAEDGWHLRANPYASPVLWTDVLRQNIQASGEGYVMGTDGNYHTLIGDGIDTLYSSEAVWIQSQSSGLCRLIFDEEDKIDANDDYNFRMAAKPEFTLPLKMELTYSGKSSYMDYSVLRFGGDTNTVHFDNQLGESRKMTNAYGNRPNISSYSVGDSSNVYYNSLNPAESNWSLPLRVWTYYPDNLSRNYSIKFNGVEKWVENNHCIILNDQGNSTSMKLDGANDTYSWSMMDSIENMNISLDHSMPLDLAGVLPATCYGQNDGTATVTGFGSGTHTYTWKRNGTTVFSQNNITGSSTAANLEAGIYTVWVSDNGACGDMGITFEITQPEEIIAQFENDRDTFYMNNSTEVNFTNTSVNASTYFWNFGDGSSSTLVDPTHTYTTGGTFTVSLSAVEDICSDTLQKSIVIVDNVGIETVSDLNDNIRIYKQEDRTFVDLSFTQNRNVSISMFNILGEEIIQPVYLQKVRQRRIELNVPQDLSGVYIIRVLYDGESQSEKIYYNH